MSINLAGLAGYFAYPNDYNAFCFRTALISNKVLLDFELEHNLSEDPLRVHFV